LEIKRYLLDNSLTVQEIANRLDFDEPTNLIKFYDLMKKIMQSKSKSYQKAYSVFKETNRLS